MIEPGGSKRQEQSFAHDHDKPAEEPPVEQLAIPWLASSRPATGSDSAQWPAEAQWSTEAQWSERSPDWVESADFAAAVRPYTWTRGRTRPVYHLEVETLVSTSVRGPALAGLNSVEHRSVAQLCDAPRSVAEIAALLSLPLGVARVLLGDMANLGLVVVHRTATNSGAAPGFSFLERVLSGLRRL